MNTLDDVLGTWAEAERTGDTKMLDTLLTDDFVGVGPLGFQLPKPAWLRRHTGGGLHYDELSLDEVSVREYGDCAVVVARSDARGTARGHPVPEASRTTLVCVMRDGQWRIAGVHHSFVAGTPGAPPLPGQA